MSKAEVVIVFPYGRRWHRMTVSQSGTRASSRWFVRPTSGYATCSDKCGEAYDLDVLWLYCPQVKGPCRYCYGEEQP